jgi:iron complex transport system substrate-binding protein
MRRAVVIVAVVLALGCARAREPASAGGIRVVSLHDVTTEMVVALGATDRLAGVAEPVDASPQVARAVAGVPRVGGLESILLARPDVVLGLGVVAEQDPELVRRLRERGIDVRLSDPATIDDVYALARDVAVATDARAAGERLVADLRRRIEQGAPARAERIGVFVYDCCDPPFTAGGRTVLTDVIGRAGGRNVFADLDADWTHVSWEEVVARRPGLVVILDYRYDGQGDVSAKTRALRAIPALAGVPAVVLPLGCALGGLRSAEALDRLRAALPLLDGGRTGGAALPPLRGPRPRVAGKRSGSSRRDRRER